jgi:aryl-alcohol dehydrogenase-like predicted oxidoreductase
MKLILGTVQFGLDYGINNKFGKPTQEQVHEIFDLAFDCGVKILDTAEAYGNTQEIIGNYHKSNNSRFEINTKFTVSSKSIENQVNSNIRLLNVDQINTLYYHSFDDFVNYPELLIQLKQLEKQGQIKHIGLSIYNNTELRAAIYCEDISVIQIPFNLLDNYKQKVELLKLAKQKGKIIQARSVFLQGLFFMPFLEVPAKLIPLLPYLQKVQEVAREFDVSVEHLSLSYALQKLELDNIIIGVDTIDQLTRNINNSKVPVPINALKKIDDINVLEVDLLYPKNWN